ncbi:hypothetical protein AAIL03_004420 [Salmonella enterica]|uniref:Lipoprotein n=3 Tax=Salmonella enterica TaxID=28901 RepID=A0A5U0MLV3_SALER|nr:hypothetical protein [Salmonella enterica]EAA5844379.1 hypothetical protein [Salmonella enterica subsp. enterica serovar Infantis]EAA8999829.1 hypothetical protein [Salmonella enterica subsp. enterica serovar Javiana]EAN0672105.1 hypothetical protein [Salmonella enterica subsp. enterica]EAO5846458.1 hypothetical protein [Salmonella enterica subsp. enterica serovar Cerro]EAQ8389902.1 hypothetical protein [Salmonella enterica subsp. enterica serovar Lubbock]EAR0686208.1 hypothetical protein 
MVKATCLLFVFLLSGCGLLPQNRAVTVNEWIAQKKSEQQKLDQENKIANQKRIDQQKAESDAFEQSHPEVILSDVGNAFEGDKLKSLRNSFNKIVFVTRYPDTDNPKQVYTYVGSYKLSLDQITRSITSYFDDCKKISAYSGADYNKVCFDSVSEDLSLFADIINDQKIPDLTKSTSLGQSTYGYKIDFGHAARLARMHFKMCQDQNNKGYVEMVTVAVPCSGHGDVLNSWSARKIGAIE